MYKKNQGYGICGAKNVYSTSVRVDNWVEDIIGSELASSSRPANALYTTVTKETHCDPSLWPEPQNLPVNLPSALELKTKNKEGMPYAILFEHSNCIPTSERFQSVAMRTMSRPDLTVPPSDTLLRQKSKAILDDINRSFVKSTEYRQLNANLIFRPTPTDPDLHLKSTELPNFKRTRPLTSTFPEFNQR